MNGWIDGRTKERAEVKLMVLSNKIRRTNNNKKNILYIYIETVGIMSSGSQMSFARAQWVGGGVTRLFVMAIPKVPSQREDPLRQLS